MKAILLRGLPGSGKSTLLKELWFRAYRANQSTIICSSDNFFHCGACLSYHFDRSKLRFAHEWCRERFQKAVNDKVDVVFVDNTNVTRSECRPYVQMALSAGYEVEFVEPHTPWAFDLDELTRRNVHGVPREAIEKMLKRWVPNLNVAAALQPDNSEADRTEDEKACRGL